MVIAGGEEFCANADRPNQKETIKMSNNQRFRPLRFQIEGRKIYTLAQVDSTWLSDPINSMPDKLQSQILRQRRLPLARGARAKYGLHHRHVVDRFGNWNRDLTFSKNRAREVVALNRILIACVKSFAG
jgi:hypothetical protein